MRSGFSTARSPTTCIASAISSSPGVARLARGAGASVPLADEAAGAADVRDEMVRVYLDPSAVFVRYGDGEEAALAPDAPAAIQDLADTGHQAILLSDGSPQ